LHEGECAKAGGEASRAKLTVGTMRNDKERTR
jgi:hypothetical protein